MAHEPQSSALFLTALGVLMGLSVASSRAAGRLGVPVALIFIVLGMLAGDEGLGGIAFNNYSLAFRLGMVALVLILFDGGLNTHLSAAKQGLRPAAVLATFGVVGTAGVLAVGARTLGFSWPQALLLGAIASPTDAAAVFSVLRGSGLHLKRRMGVALELESGLNDPLAVILTLALTHTLAGAPLPGWRFLGEIVAQIGIGAGVGALLGFGGRFLLRRIRLPSTGLYPVLTLALAFIAFGVPTLLHGSGFLSVYVTAILLGSENIRYRSGVLRVHDSLAWLAQVTMFLVLGLLVTPSRLWPVAGHGFVLALILAFVARPLVVTACLLPFRFPLREALYVGWTGLRGAVPIILATFPVLEGAPGARTIFDVTFVLVVVTAFIPGATVPWLTRRLGLVSDAPPPASAVLEIHSTQLLQGELVSFYVRPTSVAAGATLADLLFPPSAMATLIVRGKELLAPKGSTEIRPGDHVYVFCQPSDLPLVQLLLGRPEEE